MPNSFHYLSPEKFRLIAVGWLVLILFLTVCWAALLRRFAQVLQARQEATRSRVEAPAGLAAMAGFLFRSEYKRTGDAKLIAVCHRLRNLLFGYLGAIGAFVVFVILMRPRF